MNSPAFQTPRQIEDEDFLIDFYRFGSRINGVSAIANYQSYVLTKTTFDKRALFAAQQALYLGSIEDFALFLNAVHEGGNILPHLAKGEEPKTNIPKYLTSSGLSPIKAFSWLNLSRDLLIEKLREATGKQLREARAWVDGNMKTILRGIKVCSDAKNLRNRVYNKTKHGKPITSTTVDFLYKIDEAAPEDGPTYYYWLKKAIHPEPRLRSEKVPFTDDQFYKVTLNVVTVSDVIRDLTGFVMLQRHPKARDKFKKVVGETKSLREKLSELALS